MVVTPLYPDLRVSVNPLVTAAIIVLCFAIHLGFARPVHFPPLDQRDIDQNQGGFAKMLNARRPSTV
jgi:hypothetical protein